MSRRYIGGTITKNPVVPTGPYSNGTASGIWGLNDAANFVKQGIWPTAGNVNPDNFIENLFSTYLYTGTGSAQTFTNGVNLSANGGLVWVKSRSVSGNNWIQDTTRGINSVLYTNLTNAAGNPAGTAVTTFNTTGFSIGTNTNINNSGDTYASWTFREQAKFFDVVTYTGNSTARTIAHNLGSAPGCIIVKKTNSTGQWCVYHRGLTSAAYGIFLNLTDAQTSDTALWNSTAPTSSVFSLGTSTGVNNSGDTYVAYLFAHDAGGFGLTGTENVISCGSSAGGSSVAVTLGYEPQWLLVKKTNDVQNWFLMDNMRGLNASQGDQALSPNTTGAEPTASSNFKITSTGFVFAGLGTGSDTYIYIAIRRGPMKVPTTGTTVYGAVARAGTSTNATVTTGSFPPDLTIIRGRDAGSSWRWGDRLRGTPAVLRGNLDYAELTSEADLSSFNMNGFSLTGTGASLSNGSGTNYINYAMARAPSFFDEVCWTGDATNPRSISHNLTVAPTLIITKKRNSTSNWITGYDFAATTYKYFNLNDTGAASSETYSSTPVYGGNPTASVFIVGNQGNINQSADTYVSYLFATCPGVSKVGSYTGTATTKQIDCGFTAGARFVFIKRTDSTGDWYVWDSTRGIVSGNDPYLLLNSTGAEVTGTDYVDTYNAGFELSSTAPAAINANGGTYIFLAIA